MQVNKILFTGLITLLFFGPVQGQIQNDPILQSIKSEVDRNKAQLHIGDLEPPFWISYRLKDTEQMEITASMGDMIFSNTSSNIQGAADILVGDSKMNNNNFQSFSMFNMIPIGNTNKESAIKYAIWNQLDPAYKSAAESLERKKVQITQQNISDEDLNINDWDQSTPTQYYQQQEKQKIDLKFWTEYCRKASLALCKDTAILKSNFRFSVNQGDYYYYSTDSFMYRVPTRFIELIANVECRTKDGQNISKEYRYCYDDLNDVIPIENLCTELIGYNKLMIEESNAPLISDSYSGPVLFEGRAVTEAIRVFFLNNNNGLFAKRKPLVQSNNYGYNNSENRMEQMMNKKVADRRFYFISMTGTPQWKGQKLFGYTPIDAQGVKPDSSLILIENGILKNLLSDRTPTKTNPKSTGNSLFKIYNPNAELGAGVLRVSASKTIPAKALKDSLLASAKDEGYDFAYIRRGYVHLSDFFVYKVYADGREEMVRNASINELNQKQFKYIEHIGDEEFVYNSVIDGSKSTIIAPYGLIFKELEIIRNNDQKLNKPFITPRPDSKQNN